MNNSYLEHVVLLWSTSCFVCVIVVGIFAFILVDSLSRFQNFRFTITLESNGAKDDQSKKSPGNVAHRRVVHYHRGGPEAEPRGLVSGRNAFRRGE